MTQDLSDWNSGKNKDTDFMQMDAWRVMRIMSEITGAFDEMGQIDRMLVSVFGSARTAPDSPYYNSAYELGKQLVSSGYGVITGGGPGIMEAASKGAFEAGGLSVGLNIKLPCEQTPNNFQNISLDFRYFFIRKLTFLKYSTAIIVYPGGFGTMDEFSEVLTMIQTEKINLIPMIFVGTDFWGGLVEWFKKTLIAEGMISPEDIDLFKVVDTAGEAVTHLLECHRYGKRSSEIK